MGKTSRFTESYKREAVAKAQASGNISQTARELGISDKSLYRWDKAYGSGKTLAADAGTPAELVKRIEALEKLLSIREEQITVLKKAIGIVSENEGKHSK